MELQSAQILVTTLKHFRIYVLNRKLLTALNPVTLYATYSSSINLMVIWLLHVPIRPLFSLETFEKEEERRKKKKNPSRQNGKKRI